MHVFVIMAAALAASGLTLFSGFGLGTLLMPVFALFFPVEVAVAQTAAVHFANNLFKIALLGRRADWRVVLAFGLPALAAGVLGAFLLLRLAHLPPLAEYSLFGRPAVLHPVKLAVACLMAFFAWRELHDGRGRGFDRKWLSLGGLVSGFFGGLSGHQGAFRSAFLLRCGLSKEAFLGTGAVIAGLVDLSRLAVYADLLGSEAVRNEPGLIAAATAAAFAGAFLGRRLLGKTTIAAVRRIVAAMLFVIAGLLGAGLI